MYSAPKEEEIPMNQPEETRYPGSLESIEDIQARAKQARIIATTLSPRQPADAGAGGGTAIVAAAPPPPTPGTVNRNLGTPPGLKGVSSIPFIPKSKIKICEYWCNSRELFR